MRIEGGAPLILDYSLPSADQERRQVDVEQSNRERGAKKK